MDTGLATHRGPQTDETTRTHVNEVVDLVDGQITEGVVLETVISVRDTTTVLHTTQSHAHETERMGDTFVIYKPIKESHSSHH